MSLPTSPVDENLPKGPNFLAIVIGFAISILLILLVTWFILGHRKSILPMKTREATPSQSRDAPAPMSPALTPAA